MSVNEEFAREVRKNIEGLCEDKDLQALSRLWVREASPHRWAYNFTWLGRPAIQFPNDAWGLQEIVWDVRPDLIIETGIAHGGSLVYSASLLALLELCEASESGCQVDPRAPRRRVLGVDIEIRPHNRTAIERHPLAPWIQMIESSSIAPACIEAVRNLASRHKTVLVLLDSNHTHEHVLAELRAYGPMVTPGSACIVYDTLIEDLPRTLCAGRPWGPGNSPKTAVAAFLAERSDFEADARMDGKLQISVAPGGFLRRRR